MQLVASSVFSDFGGLYSLLEVGDRAFWIMEREWSGNRRSVSCVPRGEYRLVRHRGLKYPNTWALDGLTVAPRMGMEPQRARYACVIHAAPFPNSLKGCLAVARAITAIGATVDSKEATAELLGLLDDEDGHDLILL